MNKNGFFISIEGGEGVGKSTAIQYITNYLASNEINYILTREPGGTRIGEDIRNILLNVEEHAIMHSDTELLLMFAARAQNIHQVVLPALEQGQWVITDRFTDSSFAYQGGGRGISIARIKELQRWVCGDLEPDLTLLLDAPVEVGYKRIQNRGQKDRIESEGMDFLKRIRNAYLELAMQYPKRYRVINANQHLELVQEQISEAIRPLLTEYSR